MRSNLSMITQEQLAWLYEEAKRTTESDDSYEVFMFLNYLAEDHNLIFDIDKASDSLYKGTKYIVPSGTKEVTKSNFSLGDTCYILKNNKLLKDRISGIAIGKCGEYRSEKDIYYFGLQYFSDYSSKNVFRTKEEAIKSLLGED